MVIRVPYTGAEKESLKVSLDRHRDAVLWKLEGLGDPGPPTSRRRCGTPGCRVAVAEDARVAPRGG